MDDWEEKFYLDTFVLGKVSFYDTSVMLSLSLSLLPLVDFWEVAIS